jgi:transcriptional antiterminator RfaH
MTVTNAPAWYVVQSHPREEQACAEELARKGVTAYCPMVREYRARRRRQERGPLFPSYIFARFTFPEQYGLVQWSRGVRRLVRFGEDIPTLDPGLVQSLIERTTPDGLVELATDFSQGDQVKFRTGPFVDMVGTILRCDSSRDRIVVLMNLLAGETKVTVNRDLVLAI